MQMSILMWSQKDARRLLFNRSNFHALNIRSETASSHDLDKREETWLHNAVLNLRNSPL